MARARVARARRGRQAFALGATSHITGTRVTKAYKSGGVTKRQMQRQFVKAGTRIMAARRGKTLTSAQLNRRTGRRVRAMRRTYSNTRSFG